jgi:plasmid stabilization system protein ParE
MDYRVIFTESFREDLERIVRWISRHNPDAALRLGERMISMSEALAFFPERHPRIRQRPTIRRFMVQKHFKVFYRVLPEARRVEILRCWDARRGANPPL